MSKNSVITVPQLFGMLFISRMIVNITYNPYMASTGDVIDHLLSAGIAYLLTGKFETVSMGICSMIGDISGIICDGASNSCAMKVSTSVASGHKSVLMAMDETHVTGNEGIVEHDLDRTIDNLCSIASKSMHHIDPQVIEIMVSKPCP